MLLLWKQSLAYLMYKMALVQSCSYCGALTRTSDIVLVYLENLIKVFVAFRFFFFGHVTAQRDPKVYLNFILNLYDYFHNQHYKSGELDEPGNLILPLVINTSGWVKGVFSYCPLHISCFHLA